MTIEIIEKESKGNTYRNLKFSRQAVECEYIKVEKIYDEPMTGTSEFGTYYNYAFRVNELVSLNPKTGQITTSNDLGEASMFATEKLHELVDKIAINQEFKIYKKLVVGKKGEYSTFEVDTLESIDTVSEPMDIKSTVDEQWKDNAAIFLNNKVSKAVVKASIKTTYGVPDEELDEFLNAQD